MSFHPSPPQRFAKLQFLIGIASLVLFLWALIDCIKNPNLSDTQRIIWVLVILFVGCLGPVAYLIAGRNTVPPPDGPTP